MQNFLFENRLLLKKQGGIIMFAMMSKICWSAALMLLVLSLMLVAVSMIDLHDLEPLVHSVQAGGQYMITRAQELIGQPGLLNTG